MDENIPKVISRCPFKDCRKKLVLTDYACKCGIIYCCTHRTDIAHNCTYDYKSEYANKLNNNLVKVNGNKIDQL
jgi:hypothetical protein